MAVNTPMTTIPLTIPIIHFVRFFKGAPLWQRIGKLYHKLTGSRFRLKEARYRP